MDQFNCTKCKEKVPQSGRKSHVRSHMNYYPYKCSVCHAKFPGQDILSFHQSEDHDGESCECLVNVTVEKEMEVKRLMEVYFAQPCDRSEADPAVGSSHDPGASEQSFSTESPTESLASDEAETSKASSVSTIKDENRTSTRRLSGESEQTDGDGRRAESGQAEEDSTQTDRSQLKTQTDRGIEDNRAQRKRITFDDPKISDIKPRSWADLSHSEKLERRRIRFDDSSESIEPFEQPEGACGVDPNVDARNYIGPRQVSAKDRLGYFTRGKAQSGNIGFRRDPANECSENAFFGTRTSLNEKIEDQKRKQNQKGREWRRGLSSLDPMSEFLRTRRLNKELKQRNADLQQSMSVDELDMNDDWDVKESRNAGFGEGRKVLLPSPTKKSLADGAESRDTVLRVTVDQEPYQFPRSSTNQNWRGNQEVNRKDFRSPLPATNASSFGVGGPMKSLADFGRPRQPPPACRPAGFGMAEKESEPRNRIHFPRAFNQPNGLEPTTTDPVSFLHSTPVNEEPLQSGFGGRPQMGHVRMDPPRNSSPPPVTNEKDIIVAKFMPAILNFGEMDFKSEELERTFRPTPIQQIAMPAVFEGRDVMVAGKPKSGKTTSYLLPMLDYLKTNPIEKNPTGGLIEPRAMILVPSKESAELMARDVQQYSRGGCKFGVICGGTLLSDSYGCDVLIATLGRIPALIQTNTLRLTEIHFLAIDSADRVFNPEHHGLRTDLERIMEASDAVKSSDRQLLVFAERFSIHMKSWSLSVSSNFVFISHNIHLSYGVKYVNAGISHDVLEVIRARKNAKLVEILSSYRYEAKKTIVFVRKPFEAEFLVGHLKRNRIVPVSAHSENGEKSLVEFNSDKYMGIHVLIAITRDIIGHRIPGIDIVINYHLPSTIEEFEYRCGRVKSGPTGSRRVISFFDPNCPWNRLLASPLKKVLLEERQGVPEFLEKIVASHQ